jgi:cytochrome c-type biogenesis protein CcmE
LTRRNALLAGVGVIVAAFGWLLYGGLSNNIVYFLTPGELLARGASAHDKPVRLGGQVKPGSVRWDAATLDLNFTVTDGAMEVPVQSKGAPPQMFRDGMGVVVEGRLGSDGIVRSSNLMVKHSNEYRAPDSLHAPRRMYETLIRDPGK